MRHAYLIIAHHQPDLLKTLLAMLDDERNDIFVHMDARSSVLDEADLSGAVHQAGLFFTDRTKVSWGGYSMINAEMLLLKAAVARGGYAYHHLLSGVDLPLKAQDRIHDFFDRNDGMEFIDSMERPDVDYRMKYYYPLQELKGRNPDGRPEYFRNLSVFAQQLRGVDRIKRFGLTPRFGAQWFSITGALAAYVVGRAAEIKEVYGMSLCCDEIFLQTTVADSPFAERVFPAPPETVGAGCLRYIDWSRGAPYTFRSTDYHDLIESPYLFGRKFDLGVDADIVHRLQAFVSSGAAA